ncbi:hypothetical protein BWQ96_05004 [Gracilariopsis chorda]|uniref:Ribosome biogenesis protein NOP53 n=1 Tax=Gracilariopsis chorda TaxID=448386 RepID=A0A2V3ISY7_9FLOR|nr:hypothetical protein BWQ96_05004 [Gracilariopsis chorda]|eukprot:PXF45238.1 hypothetical protein BWQ96_05004 [Gracilariopsis chorda]
MGKTGTKRKRRERENRVAGEVEDGKRAVAIEKKLLGTAVNEYAADHVLFTIDRKGKSKDALAQKFHGQALQQRRAAKRARRHAPKERKSEAAIKTAETSTDNVLFKGRKNKANIPSVEQRILAKRSFDKPEGHVGNRSAVVRVTLQNKGKKDDLWNTTDDKQEQDGSDLLSEKQGIANRRRRLEGAIHAVHRSAPHIVHPDSGLSINPTHSDHQDVLGEALAEIVRKDDDRRWNEKKMSYDPAILEESTEGILADIGMKVDNQSEQSEDESEDEVLVMHQGAPDRKTRAQRNKEARKRVMACNIAKKKAAAKQDKDFENIEEIRRKAETEADKINGIAKERMLAKKPSQDHGMDAPVLTKVAGVKVRVEKANIPVTLSTELSESMRKVKMPTANPLARDRFLSFERRGFIVPPKVLPKEIRRMSRDKLREERKDRRRRKGRGAASDLTFWRRGKKAIR